MPQQEVEFDQSLMDSLDEDTTQLAEDFDPDADYNAPPPPLPDGWYQATLKCAGVKDEDQKLVPFRKRPWGNIPSTFHTSITAKIVDPGGAEDGKYATDNTVTTNIDAKKHTSKAIAYYRAITNSVMPGASEGTHMKYLLQELQAEPTVWVKTQLEGQAPDASKKFSDRKKAGLLEKGEKAPKTFRGDKAFMENGKLTGRVLDKDTSEWVVGRPVIADVKPLSFTPPAKK